MKIKQNICIMYLLSLLQGMVFYAPVATLYRQAAGVSVLQMMTLESISLVVSILLELPWGVAADRIGYRRTMILCCGLYFLSKIVFWRASGFAAFLAERLLLSVVFAGLSGVDVSVLYLSSGKEEAQKVFGIYQALGTAGLLTAAGVYAGFIREDYRLAGLLTVCSYGAAAILSFGLREVKPESGEKRETAADFKGEIKRLSANRPLLLFLLSVALLNETHQAVATFLNQIQYVKCGMTNAEIGWVYLAVTVLGLSAGFSARLTGRFGRVRFGAVLFALCAAACTVLAGTSSAAVSILAVAVLEIGFCLFQPLQTQLQNQVVQTENRATALSMHALLFDSTAVLTNLLFGKLAEAGIGFAMLLGVGLCAAGLVLFLRSSRQILSSYI